MPALAEAGIPALTLSVRSDILMEDALKKKWPFFRLVPSAKAEAAKVTEIILSRWKNEPLGLIEDGTIHGRELVESVRSALAEIGLTPTFSDTYRPAQEQQVSLVRRLAKSGATHVFTGGDRADTAIIARDAASEQVALTLMGGEALDAANQPVPLANGILAVALPDYATPAGRQGHGGCHDGGKTAAGGLRCFLHLQLFRFWSKPSDQAGKDSSPVLAALAKGPYQIVLGPIRFNANHELADNPYRLLEWQNNRFVAAPPVSGSP